MSVGLSSTLQVTCDGVSLDSVLLGHSKQHSALQHHTPRHQPPLPPPGQHLPLASLCLDLNLRLQEDAVGLLDDAVELVEALGDDRYRETLRDVTAEFLLCSLTDDESPFHYQ